MRPIAAIRMSILTGLVAGTAVIVGVILQRPSERAAIAPSVDLRPVVRAAPAPPPPPVPSPRPMMPDEEPRCCACAMERNAQAQREQQQVITARFLGVFGRFHEGRPTTQRCRPDREVWGTVRFALTGENPWRDHHPDATPQRLSRMLMSLPCPELSRSAYAKMFNGQSRWPDNLADGRGTAPVLKRGSTYRLRVVDTPDLAGETDETTELYWTLLAVDPE